MGICPFNRVSKDDNDAGVGIVGLNAVEGHIPSHVMRSGLSVDPTIIGEVGEVSVVEGALSVAPDGQRKIRPSRPVEEVHFFPLGHGDLRVVREKGVQRGGPRFLGTGDDKIDAGFSRTQLMNFRR